METINRVIWGLLRPDCSCARETDAEGIDTGRRADDDDSVFLSLPGHQETATPATVRPKKKKGKKKAMQQRFRESMLLRSSAQMGFDDDMYKCVNRINGVVEEDTGATPLHVAVLKARLDFVRQLLDEGADVRATDLSGNTPVHIAAEMGRRDPVRQ